MRLCLRLTEAKCGQPYPSISNSTAKMPFTEEVPQPENGFYVLVTGANRYKIRHNTPGTRN
jgi:hypothetical protein